MSPEALRTLVLIVTIAALSPFLADLVKRRVAVPRVVIEIALGMLIGPHLLGWAHLDEVISVLAEMGLVFLIFLAGFEIDPDEVKGKPVVSAVRGWLVSLAIAIVVAAGLHALDVTSSVRFVAIALTTTAIGTLLPILGDACVLRTRLGTDTLAGGAMGELGPIVAISVALTTDAPGRTAVVLAVFTFVTLGVGWAATREAKPRTVELIAHTLHSSGQLGVRICVLLCVLLVWTAAEFGLDVLLGAFAAGMLARLFLVEHTPSDGPGVDAAPGTAAGAGSAHHALERFDHREEVQHRIEALGFGFFIPLFFVVSGVRFDLEALFNPIELLKVPLFLALFLLVRGAPALVLYRGELEQHELRALALLQSAALPLLVVIAEIGLSTGQMRSDNAAGLVGAGLVSVIVFPIAALSIARQGVDTTRGARPTGDGSPEQGSSTPVP
ncbi:MAG: cation:proton antiporter [Acidimicrobiales bacterium]|nr:cation:proton antiporter [Acidimicrobiales bacterium]MCB9392881.1 cation:proton antiporter [Acidimicrobiaceae bacterium]